MREHTCDICGDPAVVADGIVGMYLCSKQDCLNKAWKRAFPDKDEYEHACGTCGSKRLLIRSREGRLWRVFCRDCGGEWLPTPSTTVEIKVNL